MTTIEGGTRNGPMMETEPARIMIVAQSGALYQSLAHALEEQLRGCNAVICQAGTAESASGGGVRLVLIHSSCCTGVTREIEAQRALHPVASIAVLIDSTEAMTPHCAELFAAQKIQGIVPMSLKLEVWLAAVLLLLSGGEYYPAPARRVPAPQETPAQQASPPAAAVTAEATRTEDRPLPATAHAPSSLTARERQILELLSEGHQNKLIAHKMSLSEHTVKVHVHNLLSKLRVSNRTQAAARYRKGLFDGHAAPAAMMAPDANGQGAAAG